VTTVCGNWKVHSGDWKRFDSGGYCRPFSGNGRRHRVLCRAIKDSVPVGTVLAPKMAYDRR
jgi:hypothetical protein